MRQKFNALRATEKSKTVLGSAYWTTIQLKTLEKQQVLFLLSTSEPNQTFVHRFMNKQQQMHSD